MILPDGYNSCPAVSYFFLRKSTHQIFHALITCYFFSAVKEFGTVSRGEKIDRVSYDFEGEHAKLFRVSVFTRKMLSLLIISVQIVAAVGISNILAN